MLRGRLALAALAVAFAAAAESIGRPELVALDVDAGLAFLGLGLVAWQRRPGPGVAMAAVGCTWFLGSLADGLVLLHRGALAYLLLSYPRSRPSSRLGLVAAAAGCAYAAVPSVARDYDATIVFAVALVAAAATRHAAASGSERRARAAALAAASAFAAMLVVTASVRLAGVDAERALLWSYDLMLFLLAVGLFADLVWGRWSRATATALVVDLGREPTGGPLREKLARALGDPTLVVGYWLPEQERHVDENGRPVDPAVRGAGRVATPLTHGGQPMAVLLHDAAVLEDQTLRDAVAAATHLVVANAQLQRSVLTRVAEVRESRRRLVEAADAERRRLERELREGAGRRLEKITELLAGSPSLAGVEAELVAARSDLDELARGIHPAVLTDGGLRSALEQLVSNCPVPVALAAPAERLPPAVEAATYFVCAEALTNVTKHARASRASVQVDTQDGVVSVAVLDDGIGGADLSRGSGFSGLSDRVEALGGRFRVQSPSGGGTVVRAEIPVAS
jgi:signal transduction histidine kinase